MANGSIRQAADLLKTASYAVALTGAGLSTPSGIPDFRSPATGLWNLYNPMLAASIWSFHDQPERFYEWFLPVARRIGAARPNAGHTALAALEACGGLKLTITQNIDNLHQLAGARHVVELHGHLRSATCLGCRQPAAVETIWQAADRGEIARCGECDGLLKPDVTLFGEPLNYDMVKAAQGAALRCDVMVVIGTSLEVEPAADLPFLAHRRGARLLMVNQSPTRADSIAAVLLRGDVARILPKLAAAYTRMAG